MRRIALCLCLFFLTSAQAWPPGGGGGATLGGNHVWTGTNQFDNASGVLIGSGSGTDSAGLTGVNWGSATCNGATLGADASVTFGDGTLSANTWMISCAGQPRFGGDSFGNFFASGAGYVTPAEGSNPGVIDSTVATDGVMATTYHCVGTHAAGLIAAGSSTTENIGGRAFAGAYTLQVQDQGTFANAVITAMGTASFTFTSVTGHTYAYRACGE